MHTHTQPPPRSVDATAAKVHTCSLTHHACTYTVPRRSPHFPPKHSVFLPDSETRGGSRTLCPATLHYTTLQHRNKSAAGLALSCWWLPCHSGSGSLPPNTVVWAIISIYYDNIRSIYIDPNVPLMIRSLQVKEAGVI